MPGPPPKVAAPEVDWGTAKPITTDDVDWSKVTPITQTPDSRNDIQKSFDENTRTSPSDPLLKTALKSTVGAIGTPFVHPIETVKGMARMAGETQNPVAIFRDVTGREPGPMGDMVRGPVQDYKDGGLGYAATKFAGNTLGSLALGEGVGKAIGAGSDVASNLRERFGGYESPVIPKALQQGSNVTRAIGSAGGVTPALEETAGRELPHVKYVAQQSGNPLHSQWEVEQAARDAGGQGLAHWNSILGQYGGEASPIDAKPLQSPGASPMAKTVNPQAMEARITELNDMLSGKNAAAKGGPRVAMTDERSIALNKELDDLKSQLYTEMSGRTGIPENALRDFRQQYGSQFKLADAIGKSRTARIGQMGAADEGTSIPSSRSGLIEKALTGLRGGREYVANANMRKAISPFDAVQPQYPNPQLPMGTPPPPKPDLFMGAKSPMAKNVR